MSIEELNSCLGTAERLLTAASIPRRLTACLKVRDELAMMKAMRIPYLGQTVKMCFHAANGC